VAGPFAQAGRDIGVRLTALAKSHQDPGLRQVMERLGKLADQDAQRAARADLGGDNKFSGWDRAPLATEISHLREGQVEVRPTGRGRGPWRVAESGRNRGGGGLTLGPGLNVRTGRRSRGGIRQTGVRRSSRWNGMTAPKNTWSDAVAITTKETPARIRKESLKVITTAFKAGR
jgi:hypothetical protein